MAHALYCTCIYLAVYTLHKHGMYQVHACFLTTRHCRMTWPGCMALCVNVFYMEKNHEVFDLPVYRHALPRKEDQSILMY